MTLGGVGSRASLPGRVLAAEPTALFTCPGPGAAIRRRSPQVPPFTRRASSGQARGMASRLQGIFGCIASSSLEQDCAIAPGRASSRALSRYRLASESVEQVVLCAPRAKTHVYPASLVEAVVGAVSVLTRVAGQPPGLSESLLAVRSNSCKPGNHRSAEGVRPATTTQAYHGCGILVFCFPSICETRD